MLPTTRSVDSGTLEFIITISGHLNVSDSPREVQHSQGSLMYILQTQNNIGECGHARVTLNQHHNIIASATNHSEYITGQRQSCGGGSDPPPRTRLDMCKIFLAVLATQNHWHHFFVTLGPPSPAILVAAAKGRMVVQDPHPFWVKVRLPQRPGCKGQMKVLL